MKRVGVTSILAGAGLAVLAPMVFSAPAGAAETNAAANAVAANAVAVSTAAAPAAVKLPSGCGAVTTTVTSTGTLGVRAFSSTGASYGEYWAKLGFIPKAFTQIAGTTAGSTTTYRFLAVEPKSASLQLLTVAKTVNATTKKTTYVRTKKVVATKWSSVRAMVYVGPYVYALTTTGAMTRYTVTSTFALKSAGAVATSGYSTLKSLSVSESWVYDTVGGKDRVIDVLVGVTTTGKLMEYDIPRWAPTDELAVTLKSSGWAGYSYALTGGCHTGDTGYYLGIKPSGEVDAYKDADMFDMLGSDISALGRVATGWKGVFSG